MLTTTPAQLTDVPRIQTLANTIWHLHYPSILSVEQIDYMLPLMYSTEVLNNELEEGITYEIVQVDNTDIGYISYGPFEGSTVAKLHKLYILPSFHGKRLGKTLLEHVVRECKNKGFKKIILNTHRENYKGHRAYERFGFNKIQEIKVDIKNGFIMDDFVYEYEIP